MCSPPTSTHFIEKSNYLTDPKKLQDTTTIQENSRGNYYFGGVSR